MIDSEHLEAPMIRLLVAMLLLAGLGACAPPPCAESSCCLPKVHYKTCYQTVVEERTKTCYKTVQKTIYKECRYTVCKPVQETVMRECRKVVCKPVWEEKQIKVCCGEWKCESYCVPGKCVTQKHKVQVQDCADPCSCCKPKCHTETVCTNPTSARARILA